MLRIVVLSLLLANGLYFAGVRGHLLGLGWPANSASEPHRLQNQIQAEAIGVLTPDQIKRMEALHAASAAPPVRCLQSILLDAKQAQAVAAALAQWDKRAYSLQEVTEPARWIIYMGPYTQASALAKKKAELRELGIGYAALQNPRLEPGVSLGAYATLAQAGDGLSQLARRGVRTAKLMQEWPERTGKVLKLPAVDAALGHQLDAIKSIWGGGEWLACKA